MSKPTLKVTSDFTEQFNAVVKRFKNDEVLIGIPDSDEPREEGDPITNAAILAINHFGSEDGKIPPREVLSTGIKNAKDDIAEQFKICAREALSKGLVSLGKYYDRAGIIAANSCKKVINDQDGIDPPSEATLKARRYITKSGFKGVKSLLVTGQLRNAITHVVKTPWGK